MRAAHPLLATLVLVGVVSCSGFTVPKNARRINVYGVGTLIEGYGIEVKGIDGLVAQVTLLALAATPVAGGRPALPPPVLGESRAAHCPPQDALGCRWTTGVSNTKASGASIGPAAPASPWRLQRTFAVHSIPALAVLQVLKLREHVPREELRGVVDVERTRVLPE